MALAGYVVAGVVGVVVLGGCGANSGPDVVPAHYALTPPGCLAAVDDAKEIAAGSEQVVALAEKYPPLIPGAYNAGYDRTVDKMSGVLSTRKGLDAQLATLSASLHYWTARYAADAAGCPGVQVRH